MENYFLLKNTKTTKSTKILRFTEKTLKSAIPTTPCGERAVGVRWRAVGVRWACGGRAVACGGALVSGLVRACWRCFLDVLAF